MIKQVIVAIPNDFTQHVVHQEIIGWVIVNTKDFTATYVQDRPQGEIFIGKDVGKLSGEILYYLATGKPLDIEIPTYLRLYYKKNVADPNKYAATCKLREYAVSLAKQFIKPDYSTLTNQLVIQYHQFIRDLREIESNGLAIQPTLFKSLYNVDPYDNLVYGRYNPYTRTGRPSNAWNNINYAALKKEGQYREAFISRFEKGCLIEIDFRSYHIHLIANLVGYKFKEDDVHTELGKQYFKTETLTPYQYETSKTNTFKSLYSGVYPSMPFFNAVENTTHLLFKEYTNKQYFETPIFKRRISDMEGGKASKIFNYFIQAYETERNADVLYNINKILREKQSCAILYTYDAILIDYNLLEGKGALSEIIQYLHNTNYPFSIKVGETYGTLKKYK